MKTANAAAQNWKGNAVWTCGVIVGVLGVAAFAALMGGGAVAGACFAAKLAATGSLAATFAAAKLAITGIAAKLAGVHSIGTAAEAAKTLVPEIYAALQAASSSQPVASSLGALAGVVVGSVGTPVYRLVMEFGDRLRGTRDYSLA